MKQCKREFWFLQIKQVQMALNRTNANTNMRLSYLSFPYGFHHPYPILDHDLVYPALDEP